MSGIARHVGCRSNGVGASRRRARKREKQLANAQETTMGRVKPKGRRKHETRLVTKNGRRRGVGGRAARNGVGRGRWRTAVVVRLAGRIFRGQAAGARTHARAHVMDRGAAAGLQHECIDESVSISHSDARYALSSALALPDAREDALAAGGRWLRALYGRDSGGRSGSMAAAACALLQLPATSGSGLRPARVCPASARSRGDTAHMVTLFQA